MGATYSHIRFNKAIDVAAESLLFYIAHFFFVLPRIVASDVTPKHKPLHYSYKFSFNNRTNNYITSPAVVMVIVYYRLVFWELLLLLFVY